MIAAILAASAPMGGAIEVERPAPMPLPSSPQFPARRSRCGSTKGKACAKRGAKNRAAAKKARQARKRR
jgi:hypothetical protein